MTLITNSTQRLQSLKGAIDSRIAEEQARQKAAASPISRSSSSSKRPSTRNASPAQKPRRPKPKDDGTVGRGPDPSEFEKAFVIDDEDEPVKVPEKTEVMADNNGAEANVSGEAEKRESIDSSPKAPELPTEVRAKLRKLEKLEGRYQGRFLTSLGNHVLITSRAFEVLPRSTCPSSFHRTIREGIEGKYTTSWYIRP